MVGNTRKDGIRKGILLLLVLMLAATPVSAKSQNPRKIYLQATATTVDIGGRIKVSVRKVSPKRTSKSVKWKSSNKKVATVSKAGYVTGKKKGTVTITATSTKNRKVHKKIRIKVADLKATSVKVSKSSIKLARQEQTTLKATVKGKTGFNNQGVIWKSANNSVAKVDSKGNVTGIGNGETTITATEKGGGKKASCKVTVFQTTTPKDVWNNLKTGKYVILDLRLTAGTNDEVGFDEGHLPTSVGCSVAKDFADENSIEAKSGEENVGNAVSKYGTNRNYLLIGDGGRYEMRGIELLKKNGVDSSRIYILSDNGKMTGHLGLTAWEKAYPDYIVKSFQTSTWSFKDTITGQQLQKDMAGKQLYTIIDARAKEQYDFAHAPGAWNAPCRAGDNKENPKSSILSKEERKDNFQEVVKENPDAIFVVMCYSGTRYSNNAKETLVQDYNIPAEKIIIQQGGMGSWTGPVMSQPKVDKETKQVTVAAVKNPDLDSNPTKKMSHYLTSVTSSHRRDSVLETNVTSPQLSKALEEVGVKNSLEISVKWDDFTKKGSGTISDTLEEFTVAGESAAFNRTSEPNLERGCLVSLSGCRDGLLQPANCSVGDAKYAVKKGALPTSEHEPTQPSNPEEKNVVYVTFTVK